MKPTIPQFIEFLQFLRENEQKRWRHAFDPIYEFYEKKVPQLCLVSAYFEWLTVQGNPERIEMPPLPVGFDLSWRKFRAVRHNTSFNGREMLEFLMEASPSEPFCQYVVKRDRDLPPYLTFTPTDEERPYILFSSIYPAKIDAVLGEVCAGNF